MYKRQYIDCVLIPDHASDRVGAVLFRNDKEQSSNVAFFDADGYLDVYKRQGHTRLHLQGGTELMTNDFEIDKDGIS